MEQQAARYLLINTPGSPPKSRRRYQRRTSKYARAVVVRWLPQFMTSLPDSAKAVPGSPALAHLVTLNPDGGRQVSIVWAGLDGDEIVAGHLPEHRKARNIRARPERAGVDVRVALMHRLPLTGF